MNEPLAVVAVGTLLAARWPGEIDMRTLIGFVGSLVSLFVIAGCGAPSAPTAPTAAPVGPNGFGVIVETSGSPAPSFGACLSGSAAATCFSAPRIRAGSVTFSAATAPSIPNNLVTSSSGSAVTLTWTAPSSGDAATGYTIEAGSAPGLANLANFSTGNTLTVFQASGVGAGTYYVRVRAVNAAGTSAPSNEAILVVGASTGAPPGAPSGLTNTVNAGGTVGFAWNAATGSPTTYVIEAGSQSGLANLANSDLGGTATTMTASGVGAGTYYVRVRAKNAFGISAASNEVVVSVGGAVSCNPNLSPTSLDYAGTYVSAVAVGPSSGLVATFTLSRSSGSDVFFEGRYTDTGGRTGTVYNGLIDMRPISPRVSFGFVPGFDVVRQGAIFIGDLSVCSGNKVLEFAGQAHKGYFGLIACQPGETCPDAYHHFIGPGYPMTLVRQ
jgi:fibronectin type III domain protein